MTSNSPEFTITELATALKKTVEDQFSFVKVRGEISGFKRHSSGHLYFSLKDDNALINAIMWNGTTSRLSFNPEDGLSVIASGRVTTYPGRSQYQIVIDNMEPAGIGALMALLEKRKQLLANEGLFDESRKKKLPFLPKVIGIMTSETGAVIRDIIHRLYDRYMPHILLLPVAVQGELSARQVAYGIRFFNDKVIEHNLPKPDVLIVARGGGSIEDLWSFNEEIVVRAIAESNIPIISAVGHETDFTLCDFVADVRAPTPTAAAEFSVPVKSDLLAYLAEIEARLIRALQKNIINIKGQLQSLRLPQPERLLENNRQKLDFLGDKLPFALKSILSVKKSAFNEKSQLLTPIYLNNKVLSLKRDLEYLGTQQDQMILKKIQDTKIQLESMERILKVMSYKSVLKRGFAVIKDNKNQYIKTKPTDLETKTPLSIEFCDGEISVITK